MKSFQRLHQMRRGYFVQRHANHDDKNDGDYMPPINAKMAGIYGVYGFRGSYPLLLVDVLDTIVALKVNLILSQALGVTATLNTQIFNRFKKVKL